MSFISVSPGEIFAASKSLYRIWQDTKGARERHRKAREFADCAKGSLGALRDACNTLGTTGDELLPCLDSIGKAYDDLDSYLSRFDAQFAQPPNTRGSTKLVQQVRWAFEQQIDHKVESLQSTLTAALTMCSLALVPQIRYTAPFVIDTQRLILRSLQISSVHQKALSQPVSATELAALSSNQLSNDEHVARVTTKSCEQRPKGCYCRCHISQERPWRSILFGTVGFASLFDKCNRDDCDTRRYAVYARFALSHFGVPLAIRLASELRIYVGFVPVLYPTIDVERVCNLDSPGYRLLEEFTEYSSDIDPFLDHDERVKRKQRAEACKIAQFKRLFTSGEASHLDVDPDGRTWLEVTLQTNSYIWTTLTVNRNFFDIRGRQGVDRHSLNFSSFWVGDAGKIS